MLVASAKPPSIFSTQDREHLATDEASLVFKHLKDSKQCHSLRLPDCFNILYHASTNYQLKIKEVLVFFLIDNKMSEMLPVKIR